MNKTEVQLFDNEYKMRCDTFSCGESATSVIGRPDAPLSTAMNLCAACTEQLVRSVIEKYNLVHGDITEAVEQEDPFSIIDWDEIEQKGQEIDAVLIDEVDLTGLEQDGEPVNDDNEPEVTLEEILNGVRSHAELDEIAKELGIEGLPSKETKLVDRKQYILDYDFPEVE